MGPPLLRPWLAASSGASPSGCVSYKLGLLDRTSFQVLARVELPFGYEEPFAHPTVSLSANG